MQSLTSASDTMRQADDSASALGGEDPEPPSRLNQLQPNETRHSESSNGESSSSESSNSESGNRESKPNTTPLSVAKTQAHETAHKKAHKKSRRKNPRKKILRVLHFFTRSEKQILRRSLLSVLEHLPADTNMQALKDTERAILENLLRHRDRAVEDHMVPRSEIFALPASASRAEALKNMRSAGHSRAPVYEESLDNTKGYLHLKDLIGLGEANDKDHGEDSIRQLLRQVIFTSPAINNLDLLRQMRMRRTHLALIVDEHGGVDGLVTIEDLIEEFFGEIEDEHDVKSNPPKLQKRADGAVSVDARFRLEDLPADMYQELRADAEEENIDTVGGFAAWVAGYVPKQGETLTHQASGLRFYINAAGRRRVTHLSIAPPQ